MVCLLPSLFFARDVNAKQFYWVLAFPSAVSGGATAHRRRRALLCSTISSRELTGSNPWSLCEEMTGLLIALRAARILLEVRTLEMLELSLDLAIRVL